MGASWGWKSKTSLVDYLTRNFDRWTTVDHQLVENNLWMVSNGPNGPVLEVNVLQYDASTKDWGYTAVGEAAIPYHYDCPLRFFKLVEPPSEPAQKWRDAVRHHHERKKKLASLKKGVVGAEFSLDDLKIKIVERQSNAWWICETVEEKKRYRIQNSVVNRLLEQKI